MPEIYRRRIPEQRIPGKRLGRGVLHDPRSLDFLVEAADPSTLTSVRHERYIPVLDQGDLGSCTGNAAEGACGTGALYLALNGSTAQPWATDGGYDEQQAVQLYSAATRLDDVDGSYPPDDTGSSGLAVAKACKAAGLISGYRHATSLAAALTALSQGPIIAGINWYDSFDEPGDGGLIAITKGAQVRGGHEICVDELDVETQTIGFTNSWGESWGDRGRAYLRWEDFDRLLKEDGDVTVFVPVTAPAPTPTPPQPDNPLADLAVILRRAIASVEGWLKKHGL